MFDELYHESLSNLSDVKKRDDPQITVDINAVSLRGGLGRRGTLWQ